MNNNIYIVNIINQLMYYLLLLKYTNIFIHKNEIEFSRTTAE